MKFHYGRNDFKDLKRAQENCYLLSNGLGGYSSTTMIHSLTRNDHGIFVACTQAPTERYVLISKLEETLLIDGVAHNLSSQEYVDFTKNEQGEKYLISMKQDVFPEWTYLVDGVSLKKRIVMAYGENTLAIQYDVLPMKHHDIKLVVTPVLQFCEKGKIMERAQAFDVTAQRVQSNGIDMRIHTSTDDCYIFDGMESVHDVYYAYDARDGRACVGNFVRALSYTFDFTNQTSHSMVCTLEKEHQESETYFRKEEIRVSQLVECAKVDSELSKALVKACDQFIVQRASTSSKTIIAGYPFFADWGRDTMYALEGCCISTNRFDDARAIFRTFTQYIHKGIMPNMFPQGNEAPMYNSVDASLLFIQALYYYYEESKDIAFIECEMLDSIKVIIDCYRDGSDFSIHMEDDFLISAGSGLEQLTWMDIRYKEELPTPRHGKPVEVNAFWYNALRVYTYFCDLVGREGTAYKQLADNVRDSFRDAFYIQDKGYLKDVVSGSDSDNQMRCNQIWAISTPFSPVDNEFAKRVVEHVFEELYTPYGLRTLSPFDPQFVESYGGSLYKRDMGYHQGTVWPFPLGSYFRAYLKVHKYSEKAIGVVEEQLSYFMDCLEEGCMGQIAEIYDGRYPDESRGCFAQAWSVSEILKVCKEVEKHKRLMSK